MIWAGFGQSPFGRIGCEIRHTAVDPKSRQCFRATEGPIRRSTSSSTSPKETMRLSPAAVSLLLLSRRTQFIGSAPPLRNLSFGGPQGYTLWSAVAVGFKPCRNEFRHRPSAFLRNQLRPGSCRKRSSRRGTLQGATREFRMSLLSGRAPCATGRAWRSIARIVRGVLRSLSCCYETGLADPRIRHRCRVA